MSSYIPFGYHSNHKLTSGLDKLGGSSTSEELIIGLADESIEELYSTINLNILSAEQFSKLFEMEPAALSSNADSFSITTIEPNGSKVKVFEAKADQETGKQSFVMKLTDKSKPLLIEIMNNMQNPQIKSNLNINKAIELMKAVPKLKFAPGVLENLIDQVTKDKDLKFKDRENIMQQLTSRSADEQQTKHSTPKL